MFQSFQRIASFIRKNAGKTYFYSIVLGLSTAVLIFVIYKLSGLIALGGNDILADAKKAFDEKEYSKAIALFEKSKSIYKDSNKDIYLYLGKLYSYKGYKEESLSNFKKFLDLGGVILDKESLSLYGDILIEKGYFNELIELWEGRDLYDKDMYKLSQVYWERNDFDIHRLTLEKISQYKEPFLDLQIFEDDLNKIYSNLDVLQSLQSLGVKNYDLDLYRALITMMKENYDKGYIEYSKIILYTAFVNLEKCGYINDKLYELKQDLSSKKLATYQVDFLLGKCANQSKNWQKAIDLIRPAIDWDKSNLEYREELAYSYFLKGDKDKVYEIYEDVLLIQKSWRYLQNYAFYLYKFGDKDLSLEKLKNAFQLSGNERQRGITAKEILRIGILDLRNLNICLNTDYDVYLDVSDMEGKILRILCMQKRNENIIPLISGKKDLVDEYFYALSKRNIDLTIRAIDKDTTGVLTAYDSLIRELGIRFYQ